jgi:hypothetical protein
MKLTPFIIKNIIAPHGITDLSHSLLTNNHKKLLLTNVINTGFVELFVQPLDLNLFYNIVFFLATIIHFRNDFPNLQIKKITLPNYLFSGSFVTSTFLLNEFTQSDIGSNFLLVYMTFIHVPNHYKESWFYMKKNIPLNVFLISILCIVMELLTLINPNMLHDVNMMNIAKSIIISHIMYQEVHVLNNKKLSQEF